MRNAHLFYFCRWLTISTWQINAVIRWFLTRVITATTTSDIDIAILSVCHVLGFYLNGLTHHHSILFQHYGSLIILVFPVLNTSDGSPPPPYGGVEYMWVCKFRDFLWNRTPWQRSGRNQGCHTGFFPVKNIPPVKNYFHVKFMLASAESPAKPPPIVSQVFSAREKLSPLQWLKCHWTQGNAVPAPPVIEIQRSHTSNFIERV